MSDTDYPILLASGWSCTYLNDEVPVVAQCWLHVLTLMVNHLNLLSRKCYCSCVTFVRILFSRKPRLCWTNKLSFKNFSCESQVYHQLLCKSSSWFLMAAKDTTKDTAVFAAILFRWVSWSSRSVPWDKPSPKRSCFPSLAPRTF